MPLLLIGQLANAQYRLNIQPVDKDTAFLYEKR